MSKVIHFGIGGYCENCNPEDHDHPLNNIVYEEDVEDIQEISNIMQIAEALNNLPEESLLLI